MKYVLLLFAFTGLLNQSAKAQTKKETINWLIEKMTRYGIHIYPEDTTGKINKSTFSRGTIDYEEVFDLKMVYGYTIWKDYPTGLNMREGVGNVLLRVRDNGISIHNFNNNANDSESLVLLVVNWDGEANLAQRFQKALNDLVAFNKANTPKEAY